jgi:hypothetical protein
MSKVRIIEKGSKSSFLIGASNIVNRERLSIADFVSEKLIPLLQQITSSDPIKNSDARNKGEK